MIKINPSSPPIIPPVKAAVKSLFGSTNWFESAVFVFNEFNVVIKFEKINIADEELVEVVVLELVVIVEALEVLEVIVVVVIAVVKIVLVDELIVVLPVIFVVIQIVLVDKTFVALIVVVVNEIVLLYLYLSQ